MNTVQKSVPEFEKRECDDSELDGQDDTKLSDEELDKVSGGARPTQTEDDVYVGIK